MLRRNARLRREYLYRKSLEGKERAEYERKRQLRLALEGGWPGCTLLVFFVRDVGIWPQYWGQPPLACLCLAPSASPARRVSVYEPTDGQRGANKQFPCQKSWQTSARNGAHRPTTCMHGALLGDTSASIREEAVLQSSGLERPGLRHRGAPSAKRVAA